MELKTINKQEIEEVPYGTLLWQMPNGAFVSDGEGRYLTLFAMKDDMEKRKVMRDFVKSEFGITEGRVFYMSGNRPITDEEYEEQKQRMLFGLTPDPLDVGAAREELKNVRRRG